MAAVAHGWHKPGGGGPSVKVAKEFNQADKGTGIMSRNYAKGGDIATASYAEGGAVLGRRRDFLKEQVEFRDPDEGKQGDSADADQKYAKSGAGAGKGIVAPPPNTTKNKSLKAVKPRK